MTETHDWTKLLHAYGLATDTRDHLRALLGDDSAAIERAVEHLWGAVLHQGSVYTATTAVVRWLARELRSVRSTDLQAELLTFIGEAARCTRVVEDAQSLDEESQRRLDAAVDAYDEKAFWGDEELGDALYRQSLDRMRRTAPEACRVALEFGTHEDSRVRVAAYHAAAHAALLTGDAAAKSRAIRALDRVPQNAEPIEIAAATLSLNELGADTSSRRDHPELVVRVAAALGASDDQRGREILIEALREPGKLDESFGELPQVDMRMRFTVVDALIRSATSFDELLPAALSVLPVASPFTVEYDWGAFLLAARRLHPDEEPPTFRTYLAAVVARDDLWDPQNGNARFLFEDAELPYDRAACARLAGVAVPRRALLTRLRGRLSSIGPRRSRA